VHASVNGFSTMVHRRTIANSLLTVRRDRHHFFSFSQPGRGVWDQTSHGVICVDHLWPGLASSTRHT